MPLLHLISGARPNYMKIAPVVSTCDSQEDGNLETRLIHTGQHYDDNMAKLFFEELNFPPIDHYSQGTK